MKRIILSLTLVFGCTIFVFGQTTQNTKNTADQTLRSSGRVNPSTLGMEFDLPLGSYPGRGFNLPLGLSYSSKVWRFEEDKTTPGDGNFPPTRVFSYGVFAGDSAAGWSSSLSQPYIEYTGEFKRFDYYGRALPGPNTAATPSGNYYIPRITVFLPGGGSHELRSSDVPVSISGNGPPDTSVWNTTFLASDGSGMKYVQDTANGLFRLFMPDGSYYDFDSEKVPHTWTSDVRKANRLTDANGNFVQYNAPDTENPYGSWTDQLGRVFPIMIPIETPQLNGNSQPFTDYFKFPGIDTNTPYALTWKRLGSAFAKPTYTPHYVGGTDTAIDPEAYEPSLFDSDIILQNACGQTESRLYIYGMTFNQVGTDNWTPFNPYVLAEIKLPNGASYKFEYNERGEIEEIHYPSGGHEEFNYGQIASLANMDAAYQQTNRGITQSKVYENDSASPLTSTYSAEKSANNYRTSIVAPDGTRTDNFMHRGVEEPTCNQTFDEFNYYNTRWGYDAVLSGRTYETRVFSSDSTPQLKQRTLTKWEFAEHPTVMLRNYGSLHMQFNPRVHSTQSITYDGSNWVSAVTKLEYDEATIPGSPLNVSAKREYAYSGGSNGSNLPVGETPPVGVVTLSDPTTGLTLIRTTETNYLTTDTDYSSQTVRDAYKDRNLIKLPTQILVKEGSTATKAKSQMIYDEGEPVSELLTCNLSGWEDPGTNIRGLLTTTKSWHDVNTSNAYNETHVGYNPFGSPVITEDANGNISQIQYTDNFNRQLEVCTFAYATRTISAVPGNGSTSALETQTTYDFDTGLPVSSIDVNGQTTAMEYVDPLRRPTKVTVPNGHQTITEYGEPNSSGQYPEGERFVKVKSQIDASTWKEGYTWFDGLNRTVKTEKVENGDNVYSFTCFDSYGRTSKTSNPFRGTAPSNPCASTTLEWTTNTYDASSRLWKVTTPDGAFVETNYSLSTGSTKGTVTTVKDQAGKLRRSVTNALGHLVRVDEPDLSSSTGSLGDISSPYQPTNYTYDVLNNLLTVTQASSTTEQCGGSSSCSQTRTFTYDDLSRLKTADNPESGTITYSYDANGNLTSKKDARNITTNYTYDALNRVIQRSYTTPTATPTPGTYQNSPTVNYYYDNVTNAKGKLTKVSSSISTTEYTSFDILGRVTASKQTTDGGPTEGYTMGYAYNLSGALIEQTYPSGRKVQNVLDNNGDLAIVQSKKNENMGYWRYADAFMYNAAGAVTSMQLGNGRWESTVFNNRLQPTEIKLGTTQGTSNYLSLAYSYGTTNNNGNILSQTIAVPDSACSGTACMSNAFTATQTYTYDSLNRIKSAVETADLGGTWSQAFNYDRYGNRKFDEASTSMPTSFANPAITNPSISPNSNKITSAGWGYDAAGNTLTDAGAQTYVYDGENKMVKASNGSGTLGEYFYDGDGKRVKKIAANDGGTTIFVYDAAGKLVAEYSYAAASIENAKVAYLTNDHLGSPRINTDRDGNVTSRHDYHPFGEEIVTDQREGHSDYTPDSVRKQFTGYERDDETNLDYAKARYFGNSLGRFTSPDDFLNDSDIRDPQSWNAYVYCRNNPLKYTDPSGKKADVEIKIDEKTKKGTIKIRATIGIWTKSKAISRKDMIKAEKQIKDSIDGAWKGTVDKDGITYTVTTDVTVTSYATEEGAKNSGAQNVVEMEKGPISSSADSEAGSGGFFTGHDAGRWNINSMAGSTPAHEFGHLLGVHNKEGNVLMNTNRSKRHPTMTAEDFDWTFGTEVTNQRNQSRYNTVIEDRERGWKKIKVDTGSPQDSRADYTFSAPKHAWWWKSQ